MVKMFYLLKRRSDMDPEEFQRYWREHHGPLFRGTSVAQRLVVRYEQNHSSPSAVDIQGDGFDGVSIMWFRSPDDITAMYADPEFLAVVQPDGEKFLDSVATVRVVTASEEVVIP